MDIEIALLEDAMGFPFERLSQMTPEQAAQFLDGRRHLVRFDWPSGVETVVKEL